MIDGGTLSRAAVLVPLYKDLMTRSEDFSFRNTLTVLGRHDAYVVCPMRLRPYVDGLKRKHSTLRAEYFPDKYFSGIVGYNRLLKSNVFYKRFKKYEYVLIVQTDALVFSDELTEWCDKGYSYIGAPLFEGFDNPVIPPVFMGGGNGGFSLRKVQDFIRVLSCPRRIPNVMSVEPNVIKSIKHHYIFAYSFPYFLQPQINEDLFWGLLVPICCEFFTVAAPECALSFSFDVAPEYLFELNKKQLPFGCHAWEKYNLQFWRKTLYEHGIELP